MALSAIFGITNDGLNLAVNLLLLFLVVLWLALVFWTHADAKRRIADPMLVGCATVAALFPFVGTVVYMVVRPPEYLEDVHERELEIAAAEARLAAVQEHACPYCEYPVERSFLRCPSCLRRLKEPCGTCNKPLDPRWKICPYCEAEVPERAKPQQRRRGGGGASRGRERPPAAGERPATSSGERETRPKTQKRPAAKADQRPATSAGARESAEPRRERKPASAESGTTEAERPSGPPRVSNPQPKEQQIVDRTLILVKPDAFERNLTGEVIARFERKGLKIAALKQMTVARETAEQHYAEHSERPFFGELVDFITGGPLVALVLEGHEAVKAARQLIGATNPIEAAPGSIRGDFGLEVQTNLVHGSDSPESAAREIGIFFPEL